MFEDVFQNIWWYCIHDKSDAVKRLFRDLSESNSKVVEHWSQSCVHEFMLAVYMYIIYQLICIAFECCTLEYPMSDLYLLGTHVCTRTKRLVCIPRKDNNKWDIPGYATREYCISILYHAMENTLWPTQSLQHVWCLMGIKAECSTIKYTAAFL